MKHSGFVENLQFSTAENPLQKIWIKKVRFFLKTSVVMPTEDGDFEKAPGFLNRVLWDWTPVYSINISWII